MSKHPEGYVELQPQGEVDGLGDTAVSSIPLRGGFSPAFDIPVEVVVDRFKEELIARAADKTWENDYDGFDIFHTKAIRSIEAVVDHEIPRVDRCSAPGIVKENIGPQAEQHYDDWEVLAESWISQWLMLYDSILETNVGADVEAFEDALRGVYANELMDGEDAQALAEHLLDQVESE